LYSGFPIGERVDIWALGCIVYTLLFFTSPFNPKEKLDQINGRYSFPAGSQVSEGMKDLLKRTLEPDPTKRITSAELWSIIDSLRGAAGNPTNMESDRDD
jgi:cyclin G-associated kinase